MVLLGAWPLSFLPRVIMVIIGAATRQPRSRSSSMRSISWFQYRYNPANMAEIEGYRLERSSDGVPMGRLG